MAKMYYGAKSTDDILRAAKRAVRTFGGDERTVMLLVGTCAVETDMCTFPDRHPNKLGVGGTQFDMIGFKDTIQRTRLHNRDAFYYEYGKPISKLKLKDLAEDIDLAMALTRLKYILVPSKIPHTMTGLARYWKKHYNTDAGKGTVEKFLEDWDNFAPIHESFDPDA